MVSEKPGEVGPASGCRLWALLLFLGFRAEGVYCFGLRGSRV